MNPMAILCAASFLTLGTLAAVGGPSTTGAAAPGATGSYAPPSTSEPEGVAPRVRQSAQAETEQFLARVRPTLDREVLRPLAVQSFRLENFSRVMRPTETTYATQRVRRQSGYALFEVVAIRSTRGALSLPSASAPGAKSEAPAQELRHAVYWGRMKLQDNTVELARVPKAEAVPEWHPAEDLVPAVHALTRRD